MADVKQASTLLGQFTALLKKEQFDDAKKTFNQIKILMIGFTALPPMNVASTTAAQENSIALSAYETGAWLALHQDSTEDFERCISQLKVLYRSGENSEGRDDILGMYLLHLLVGDRLAEFHAELEMLPIKTLEHASIAFPIMLERNLMEGAYTKVLEHGTEPAFFHFFKDALLTTVRDSIAQCCEVTYKTIPVKVLMKKLMFEKQEDLQEYMDEFQWTIGGDGKVSFNKTEKEEANVPYDLRLNLIKDNLAYATELERIV